MAGHGPAIFVGDAMALDFLNSVATPVDTPIDWIDSGDGLVHWLDQAGLVPADALKSIRTQALPGELDKVARRARELREWFRGFVDDHVGRPLVVETLRELEPLNRLLAQDEMFGRIVLRKTKAVSLAFEVQRRWRSPESLFLPIAEALAQFICTEEFSRVKACEGDACTLVFADHTRGQARRWCSMAICGNRAKQAAYRQRLRAGQR